MKGYNAIVITYVGESPSQALIEKIAGMLVGNGVTFPELLKIVTKDDESIADALLSTELQSTESQVVEAFDKTTAAAIFIGKKFAKTLASGDNYRAFAIALVKAVINAKSYDSEENTALLNAIETIANCEVTKLHKVARFYRITNDAINVIRQVYNTAIV